MQCADGSLQAAALDANGAVHLGATTKPLFTADDPASDKPVRIGPSTWLFTTFAGDVAVIDGAGGQIAVKARWKLAGPDESAWRPGGLQPLAYHAPSGRLFVLMHKGGAGTQISRRGNLGL
jgi:methylamine dehydrogenase heavy chain